MMHKMTALVLFAATSACSSEDAGKFHGEETSGAVVGRHVDPQTATSVDQYAGDYHLVYDNGQEITATFGPDGTVAGAFSGGKITARFTVPEAGRVCFDDVSTGDPPHCWANSAANDSGAWVATMDDGSTLTVTPVGGEG